MRRREFITLVGGAVLAWPLAVRAQQVDRVRRVGVLMFNAESDVLGQTELAAFREALLKLDWAEGRNVELHVRWAGADVARIRVYAAEIVGRAPDVILAVSGTVARAVQQETARIPIVLAVGGDIVQGGLVTNLARPEGNLTGFIAIERSLVGKWIELPKALAPNAARVAIVVAPENRATADYLGVVKRSAQGWNVAMTEIAMDDDVQIERDIAEFAHAPDVALLVLPGPSTFAHRGAIVTAAARHHLPAIYPYPAFAADGGLLSYGPDEVDIFRRSAGYVDRILRGEIPGNLPIQLPTKFDLTVNLKTAKALGLTVPPSLLAIADEVIE